MIESLRQYLHGAGAPLLSGGSRGQLRLAKSSYGKRAGERVKFFVFCGAEARPRLVCHAARDRSGEERIRLEWDVRRQIQARLTAELQCTVPAPLELAEIDGAPLLIERGLSGTAMLGQLGARRLWKRPSRSLRYALDAAAQWLAAFQTATQTERRLWTAADEEDGALRAFERVGRGLDAAARRGLADELRRRLRPLRGLELRWAAQHGDFWPGNILVDGNGLGVVDWEVASPSGLCFVDPLLFAFYCVSWRALFEAERARAGGSALPSWLRTAVHRFVERAAAPVAGSPAELEAAFLVSLLARCQVARPDEVRPERQALLAALRRPRTLEWLRG